MRRILSFAVVLVASLVLLPDRAQGEVTIRTMIQGDFSTVDPSTRFLGPGGVTGTLFVNTFTSISTGTFFGTADSGGDMIVAPGGYLVVVDTTVAGNVTVRDKGEAVISGGTFGTFARYTGDVSASAGGLVTVSGGKFRGHLLGNVVDYRRRTIAALSAAAVEDPGFIEWRGGEFDGGLILELVPPDPAPAALLAESGLSLAVAVDDVPSMPVTIIGTGLFMETETTNYHDEVNFPGRTFTYSALSGTLADGTVLSNVTVLVEQGIAPMITLVEVPEPSSFALAALGCLAFAIRRRYSRLPPATQS